MLHAGDFPTEACCSCTELDQLINILTLCINIIWCGSLLYHLLTRSPTQEFYYSVQHVLHNDLLVGSYNAAYDTPAMPTRKETLATVCNLD